MLVPDTEVFPVAFRNLSLRFDFDKCFFTPRLLPSFESASISPSSPENSPFSSNDRTGIGSPLLTNVSTVNSSMSEFLARRVDYHRFLEEHPEQSNIHRLNNVRSLLNVN